MAEFTLFEVHLHDGFEFSPTNLSPLVGEKAAADDYDAAFDEEADYDDVEAETDAESETDGSNRGMALLFGLVLLVGIAAAVRFLRGGDDVDELESLDETPEEVEAEA